MELSFFLDKTKLIENEFELDNICQIHSKNGIFSLGSIAWNIGVLTALEVSNFDDLPSLTQPSFTVPSTIIFSDYNKLTNTITLYKDAIEKYFLPNVPSNFSIYSNYENAVYLLKLHEYFHYLQCSNYNYLCVYPMNCLNEIAAYSFAQKISGISFE